MEIAITRMSSKGQIVIPAEMRADIPAGEDLVIIKSNEDFVIRKAKKMSKKMLEDLEFGMRTEAALKRYENNPASFKTMEYDAFLDEVRKWSKQHLKKNSKKNSSK